MSLPQDPKMPSLLHGSDDAIVAENVKMLKNRGFDEADAVKLAREYAQNMSDISAALKAVPGKKPKPLEMAAPSEKPLKESDSTEETGEAADGPDEPEAA